MSNWKNYFVIQLECPIGKYGQNCERKCKCLNGGKCDHVTGQCDCKVGFYGDTCLECPEGNYGKNCSMECNCQNGGVCNKVVGSCDCLKPGFHGDKCQHCMSFCSSIIHNRENFETFFRP